MTRARRTVAREDAPGWQTERALDTSVLIAAYGEWDPRHERAYAALETSTALVTHAMLEAYSVLTRLPQPLRAPGILVAEFLDKWVAKRTVLALPPAAQLEHIQLCAELGIVGGAIYDAFIAAACVHAKTKTALVTFDKRARATYQKLGVDVVML